MRLFYDSISESNDIKSLLEVLSNTSEYDELPVRHNEDKLNEELSKQVVWPADVYMMDDPHTKANLLLQVIYILSLSLSVCALIHFSLLFTSLSLCSFSYFFSTPFFPQFLYSVMHIHTSFYLFSIRPTSPIWCCR